MNGLGKFVMCTAWTVACIIGVAIAFALTSCRMPEAKTVKEAAKDALSGAQAACLVAHAFAEDQELLAVCDVVQEAAPAAKQLLQAHRMAVHRHLASARCVTIDGGK